jgi:hypothetical protein
MAPAVTMKPPERLRQPRLWSREAITQTLSAPFEFHLKRAGCELQIARRPHESTIRELARADRCSAGNPVSKHAASREAACVTRVDPRYARVMPTEHYRQLMLVAPASTARTAPILRKPWKLRCGTPAFTHQLLNLSPMLFELRGLPDTVANQCLFQARLRRGCEVAAGSEARVAVPPLNWTKATDSPSPRSRLLPIRTAS